MIRLFMACSALLVLNSALFAKPYRGGELYSIDTVKYGRFEIRMRMANGPGVISSFFLYYNNSYMGGGEPWREIDVEALGNAKNKFQTNLITGDAESRITSEKNHTSLISICDNYHTYTIDWTPDSIVWYFDGSAIRKTTGKPATDCQQTFMTLRFNDWISADPGWVGAPNPALIPTYHFIHWIKYYAYTPAAGPGGSNFTLSWTDDFETFSSSRWMKGNWTFDGNLVSFTPNNIVVQSSNCIICVTDSVHTGFSGTVPQDLGSPVNQGPRYNYTHEKPMRADGISSLVTLSRIAFPSREYGKRATVFSINGRMRRDLSVQSSGLQVVKTRDRSKQQ